MKLRILTVLLCVLLTASAWATGLQVDFLLSGLRDPLTDEPLTGGKVYSYAAGTLTAKSLYTDATLATPAANPVILDAYGRAQVFGNGKYKLVIKTSDDVTLLTLDALEYNSLSTLASDTTDPFGSSLTQTNLTVQNLTATLSANLDANGYHINNLATPTANGNPVTKSYFDGYFLKQSATPTTPVNGMIWYDTATPTFRGYASGTWVSFH